MSYVTAMVVDEDGKQIGEDDVVFSTVLMADCDTTHLIYLQFIDPYGDTVFNSLQIPMLMEDLRVIKAYKSEMSVETITRLESLCLLSMSKPHLYLKFVGD